MTPDAAKEYLGMGFDPIPLVPGRKKPPLCRGWQTRAPAAMWAHAPDGANVGLRCGGHSRLAVLDADEDERPGTFVNLQNFLFGLGYEPGSYPVIQTPSGGRHIYTTLSGELAGHARNWSAGVGAGEFRFGPAAYVAAPPSIVEGIEYRIIAGDLRQTPTISVADIQALLGSADTTTTTTPSAYPRISRLAWRILKGDAATIARYTSRSEAEMALIASLVNNGHDFGTVRDLFAVHPCAGKYSELYAENPKYAVAWLKHSYDEARQWVATHESAARRIAAAAIAWAEARPWPGRTGATDRAVFMAHARLAYQAGRTNYGADVRTLAERAGVNKETASASTRRLIQGKLLTLEVQAEAKLSNRYRLTNAQNRTLPKNTTVRECTDIDHDAFRGRGGLGKVGAEIWGHLRAGPLTLTTLAELTGRTPRTLEKWLYRMARIVDPVTAEVVSMVEQVGDVWRMYSGVDLDYVARVLGTLGAGKRQRVRHEEERRLHRAGLKLERKAADK